MVAFVCLLGFIMLEALLAETEIEMKRISLDHNISCLYSPFIKMSLLQLLNSQHSSIERLDHSINRSSTVQSILCPSVVIDGV